MATIIIHRKGSFNNRMREYHLFLDGKKVASIGNGQSKEVETTAGQHTIIAKIDWCSSQELTLILSENEKVTLTVDGFKNSNWIMPLALGSISLHFLLKIIFRFEYLIFLMIPTFLLLLYYLTIGRKKYLSLTIQ